MQRHFKAIGISYKNTPLEVRESVAFDETQTKQFLVRLKEVLGVEEAMVVSTCNRTEIYFYSEKQITREIAAMVDIFHGTGNQPSAPYFQELDHDQAIDQLFSVALGLESMVLGDIQITNQVKKAYQWSADENMAGPFLHRLMHTVFFTNKRVVQETAFRDGNASVASAAVGVADKFMVNFAKPRVLIVGLGEIGLNVAENMKESSAEIILMNRTFEVAAAKSAEFNFKCAKLDELDTYVKDCQIIISAVRAEQPIITAEMLENKPQSKLLIDLSVPRSIAEQVESVPGILLYNVDQLQDKAAEALKRRQSIVSEVKSIITESVEEFNDWSQEMEVSPTIKKLKQALEDIRQQELARYLDKLDDKHAKLMDQVTKNMIQKVIKLPVLQLKAACKRGEAETLVDVLNDLFNLEKEESKTSH